MTPAPRLNRLCLPLALAAALATASPGFAPPVPAGKDNPNPSPDVEEAKPADSEPSRIASQGNLKQLALAMHNYEAVHGHFPADVTDRNGKVLLSWRVLLLPYLEQEALYKKFKLDEPWDSKHNKPLLAQMPRVFASPRVTLKNKGYTVYQGFSGPDAFFRPGKKGPQLLQIADGTSCTLLFVESTSAVPWTKPADVPFDSKKDLPKFGKAFGDRPLAALCDGSTRVLDLKKISRETLKAAITTAGGETLGQDW